MKNAERIAYRACALGVVAFVWACSAASNDVDFATSSFWGVGQGRLPGKAGTQQVRRDTHGLHVTLDPLGTGTTLASVEAPHGRLLATPGEMRRLVCRFSTPSAVKDRPRLLVRDAQMEIFQYSPCRTRRLADGAFEFTYLPTDDGYRGTTWGSKLLNRRLDSPVSVFGFVFDYAEPACTGSVTLVRYDGAVSALPATQRTVTGTEDLSDRLTAGFPGPKPFPGPAELVLTCDPPPKDPVRITLTPRDARKPCVFTAPPSREMRFTTDLPFDETYSLVGISPRPPQARMTLRGRFRQTAAEAARLDVDTGNALHISRGDDEPVTLMLHNTADRTLSWTGSAEVRDFFGHGFDVPLACTAAAGATVCFPLPRALAKGIWRVTARLGGEDRSEAVHETRFAVLDRHGVTPKVPFGRFRLGVNYHMARFNAADRRITLDALTAMGAKIVRAGVEAGFGAVCGKGPNDFDWKRPDELIGLLEARGLALDTSIYGTPAWARRPGFEKCTRPHLTPVREEALENFCRVLAARYGERIDYYELGNEWDLVKPGEMTAADAVGLVKAAYRGLKAGDPKVRAMPNGWALEASDHPMIVCKGFQEDVMEQTKGFYDIHPIHVHGRFPYYETRMREAFFAFRRARGITAPWFANETALTSAHGAEDLVAETVYKKILWSQAFGSTDYIWYNLRATGWVPSDGEQGYGLITADNYPRAGYAAFSAVAAVFGGMDADGVLVAERDRFVFRFKGSRAGRPYRALAGWDANLATDQVVRIHTDAARACVVDLMGNATPCALQDGVAYYPLGKMPRSLVLEGATRAEPETRELRAFPPPRTDVVVLPLADPALRGPDFVLNRSAQAQELWKANPVTEYRTWKGPNDLSAEIRLGWGAEALTVLADVVDDIDVPGAGETTRGDAVHLRFVAGDVAREVWLVRDAQGAPRVLDGAAKPLGGASVKFVRAGVHTRYAATLPWKALGFRETKAFAFNVRVMEDDGEGPDGWLAPDEPERPDRLSRVLFRPLRQW